MEHPDQSATAQPRGEERRRDGFAETPCARPTCKSPIPLSRWLRGADYCSDSCRTTHWDETHPRQYSLPVLPQPDVMEPRFDGESYIPNLDGKRLCRLGQLVFNLMTDGNWRTVAEIKAEIESGSEGGIGSRLRDFRKRRFGWFWVPKRRRGDAEVGLFEFRLDLHCPRCAYCNGPTPAGKKHVCVRSS